MPPNKVRQVLLVAIILGISLLITGCWDARELQERNFVLAAAIDVADAGGGQGDDKTRKAETFVQTHGSKKYRLSIQVLKLTGGGGGRSGGGGGSDASRTFVLSNTGDSLFEMVRDTLGQSSKGLYWEHIHTIVISEAAVKKAGIAPLTDFFRRDPEMRWRTRVLITPGEAREILELKTPTNEPGGLYLSNTLRFHSRNPHIPGARTDLGYLSQDLDNRHDFVLPRIVKAGKLVKVGGGAAFKKDKLVGFVDERVIFGTRFINGTLRSGIIDVECKEHPGQTLSFEIFNHDTRLKCFPEGDNVYFTLDTFVRGNLAEVTCGCQHDTDNPKYLREAEVAFAKEIKRLVLYSHETSQKMGSDFNKLGPRLKTEDPKAWKRVEGRWEDIFPTVPLIVSASVSIRNIGEHK
ncbi:MAG: Ger(x)C family spore germination protein [Veillonellaceae bacterium]|nr:Ger(x)C family spore germination protein [Veillonellaceae bacterium]